MDGPQKNLPGDDTGVCPPGMLDRLRQEAIVKFTDGVSHDLNNILAMIRNNVELAKFYASGSARSYLESALEAADRGTALVGALLSLSKNRVGISEPTDIESLVAQCSDIYRKTRPNRANMTVDATPGLWPANTSPGRLRQVMTSICDKVFSAIMGNQPDCDAKMAVKLRNIEHANGEAVSISIEFPASGNVPNDEAGLREFFGDELGTAGLAGGWTDVSHLGARAAIVIGLPRAGQTAPQKSALAAAGSLTGGSESILIVDDERNMADTTSELLGQIGYAVTCAYSATEALNILNDHEKSFDLVLTDLVMPDMDGMQLIRQASAIRPALPFIIISGNSGGGTREAGLDESGNVHRLMKPFGLDSLCAAIRKALGPTESARRFERHINRLKVSYMSEKTIPYNERVTDSSVAYGLFKCMATEPREKFVVLLLDSERRIIGYDDLTQGTYEDTEIYPQEILKTALVTNCSYIILAHNHPSGDSSPSPQDIELTTRVINACKVFGLELMDHIIISRDGYFSFFSKA